MQMQILSGWSAGDPCQTGLKPFISQQQLCQMRLLIHIGLAYAMVAEGLEAGS